MRADGNARYLMIKSIWEGKGLNEKQILEHTDKPVVIVIGKKDPFINNQYIEQEVQYSSLVGMHFLDCGHAPHWEKPEEFTSILDLFVQKIEKAMIEKKK